MNNERISEEIGVYPGGELKRSRMECCYSLQRVGCGC